MMSTERKLLQRNEPHGFACSLKVCCKIDENLYPKGIKVIDEEMAAINITRNEFHGEWNYTISPNQQPP